MVAKMTIFNIGIVLSLLSLHEIGHVVLGMYTGCQSGKAIIFDTTQQGPYAELICSGEVNYNFAYMGSFIIPMIFGSVFLFLRNSPQRNFFFVILGFSILFCSLDIVAATGIPSTEYLFIALGMAFVIVGEFLTSLAYSEI
jgi:hypothetical protein